MVDNFKDFINLHYSGERRDSKFWRMIYQKEHLTDFTRNIIELARHRGIFRDDFLYYYGCTGVELWIYTLFGMGHIPKKTVQKIFKKPIEIYNHLRKSNPSPFMFYFNYEDFNVLGSSPEILVRLRNGEVTIRPIAGTRPRGRNKNEDKRFEIDLLKELDPNQREILLAEMDPENVQQIRSLLKYNEDTAGGMMTPEAIVLTPESTVADAIARLRDTDLPPAISVRLFITESPIQAPTGKYLGSVTLARLLREPPTCTVGDCIDNDVPTLSPEASEKEVAGILARYDLLAVAVVDAMHRLVGVVTVDDVIIRLTEGAD